MRHHLSSVCFLSYWSLIQKDSESPSLYLCLVVYCLFWFQQFYHSRFQMESLDPLRANFCGVIIWPILIHLPMNIVFLAPFVEESDFSPVYFSFFSSCQVSDDYSYKYLFLCLLFYPVGPHVYFFPVPYCFSYYSCVSWNLDWQSPQYHSFCWELQMRVCPFSFSVCLLVWVHSVHCNFAKIVDSSLKVYIGIWGSLMHNIILSENIHNVTSFPTYIPLIFFPCFIITDSAFSTIFKRIRIMDNAVSFLIVGLLQPFLHLG